MKERQREIRRGRAGDGLKRQHVYQGKLEENVEGKSNRKRTKEEIREEGESRREKEKNLWGPSCFECVAL